MLRLFHKSIASSSRVLVLDAAPGIALKSMLTGWQKIPNVELVINNSRLLPEDRMWLSQQYISQVSFDPLNESELIKHFDDAGGYPIITSRLNVPFKKTLLEKFSSTNYKHPLKIIGQAGSTVSHIDLTAATEHSIAVTYTPGANANAVAEYVLAQIFNLTRRILFFNESTHASTWSKYSAAPVDELSEKTLGLIGFGHIAQAVSVKANALGMPILVYSRTRPSLKSTAKLAIAPDLETLLKKSDIISVHAPLTSETRNLIGAKEISIMKEGSCIINTSRGGVIDEDAVARELKKPNSRLSAVAFDVFENEGAKFNSPLIGCKNAILTPHIAGTTNAALSCAATQMVENIYAILSNTKPFVANPEVLKKNLTCHSRL